MRTRKDMYGMNTNGLRNYGADDSAWELWHRGPVRDSENVVLVHGYRLPWAAKKGKCDRQFADLDGMLQDEDDRFNVWQFEYAGGVWGTAGPVATYASRLGEAIARIESLTGSDMCSIVAYSMGGIIARQYIISGGRSRVGKLLTLATPHLGTLRFQPFSVRWPRFFPQAAAELRPDSALLWGLNTRVEDSVPPEFAAIGGCSNGHTDGLIETGSNSLVRADADGSVAERLYFAAVDRTHLNINRITDKKDEVYQLVLSFLRAGVAGISRVRPPERPGDYGVRPFFTFALKQRPAWRILYPLVIVAGTGRRYHGLRVFSQGERTEDGSYIFTAHLRPDDDGEVEVRCAPGASQAVSIQRGQSFVLRHPIEAGMNAINAVSVAAA
jgi:pimeloyl-ACP methyl ester carboxylesterase